MGRDKKTIRLCAVVAVIMAIGCVVLANLDTSIRVGVDGVYRQIHMPLYAKWTQFLARHYEYARLIRGITAERVTDEDKVLAILAWTGENIKDTPPGMPVCDDHIANIIIRGYGTPEQFQDVFTTLCAYAGFPAYWDRFYDKARDSKIALSLVKIGGAWRVFDAHRGIERKNVEGEVPDLAPDIRQPREGVTLRPYRQMPLRRFMYELRKALKIEKEETLDE